MMMFIFKECMLTRLPLAFSLLLMLFASEAYSTTFVDAKPLHKLVNEAVVDCKAQKTLQLPIITWGADLIPIYANGGKSTTPQSLFGKEGLSFNIVREDVFANQVKSFVSCKTPFLRGTLGMLHQASEVTEKDPRTKLVILHQLSWSAGGDALVVKTGIAKPSDLKGKTVALQAYGPHVDYLGKVLEDAGLSLNDVKIKWVRDLTGTLESPMQAFKKSEIDAAVVIIPDALALTSNGNVGTGAEDSVKGATILLSTKSANKVIADVYAVRSDFYQQNEALIKKFVAALLTSQTEIAGLWKDKSSNSYKNFITLGAQMLLDSSQATKDVEGMYADAEMLGASENQKFFNDQNYPRNLINLNTEVGLFLKSAKLLDNPKMLKGANWDYKNLGFMVAEGGTVKQRFDSDEVAKTVMLKDQQGTLANSSLFSFEVFFKPNQNSFTADDYQSDFKKVVSLASTYGGAIITIEGHSDPMAYLKQQKEGIPEVALNRLKQSAKNLSLTRATAVRDAVIKYAESKSVALDPSQFAVVGHGIAKPKTGVCGQDPCQPKTEKEWLSNMRVEFRIVQMEAEESVFKPL